MGKDYSDDPCVALYSTRVERVDCRKANRRLNSSHQRRQARVQANVQAKANRIAARQAAKAARIAARKAARNPSYAAKNKTPGVDIPWQNTDLA